MRNGGSVGSTKAADSADGVPTDGVPTAGAASSLLPAASPGRLDVAGADGCAPARSAAPAAGCPASRTADTTAQISCSDCRDTTAIHLFINPSSCPDSGECRLAAQRAAP